MPKIVTEEEKESTKKMIRQKTQQLIQTKGLKNTTITAICQAVPIGKGTFYYYYPSKEVLIYEILCLKEEALIKQIMSYKKCAVSTEEKIIKALTEVYIGENSIVNFIAPDEIEQLIHQLPERYVAEKEKRGQNFFEMVIQTLDLNPRSCNMGVLSELLDCVNFLAARKACYGETENLEALQILIRQIASYMVKGK